MRDTAGQAIGCSRQHFDVFVLCTALPLVARRCLDRGEPEHAAELTVWYLDLLERTDQGASMAVREIAVDVEREMRDALGASDFGRIGGRGAALTIAELAEAASSVT
ncbi:MAG: hypothetical protein AAGF73_10770 [Actinomycetota bacterium]